MIFESLKLGAMRDCGNPAQGRPPHTAATEPAHRLKPALAAPDRDAASRLSPVWCAFVLRRPRSVPVRSRRTTSLSFVGAAVADS